MTIGNKSVFAIESSIAQAYSRLSLRALGCFVLHIKGVCYGVRAEDATLLACSFDEVRRRLSSRGKHLATFATELDPGSIASAFRDAVYVGKLEKAQYFGIPHAAFSATFHRNHILWAPDGDQAFDDGSYVLQFDVGNRVRLIAFKLLRTTGCYDPLTLTDIWLEADDFYGVLKNWVDAFEAEWDASPQIVE